MAPSYYDPLRYEELSAEPRPTLHRLGAFLDDFAEAAPPDLAPGGRARRDISRALITACGGVASAATMISE